MPRSLRKTAGESGRAILRSLLARLRDDRQAPLAAQVLDDAERRLFLHEYEAFHAHLREQDPDGWAELEQERREFDGTLMDGLRDG